MAEGDQLQDMLNLLYNLSPNELRALAWEALLMSDGPDKISADEVHNNIHVSLTDEGEGPKVFTITSENW